MYVCVSDFVYYGNIFHLPNIVNSSYADEIKVIYLKY